MKPSDTHPELKLGKGTPQPFGVSLTFEGYNFSLYSKFAKEVTLYLFEPNTREIKYKLSLLNKTGHVWHLSVQGIEKSLLYAYVVKGRGHWKCEPPPYLLDPYAKAVHSTSSWGDRKIPYQPLGIVNPSTPFDWEGASAPRIPVKDLIIYEMHVRGFTRHQSSNVKHSGTYLGIIEKIPYLKELGVNAIKLLPIQEFNENEVANKNPQTGEQLVNYWGYSTVNFFSPISRYGSIQEFKTLVRELHRNGLEVILDIVFNHTAEGDSQGPCYSFKGIDPKTYYIIDSHHQFQDFTGCGNTFNCNNPVVIELIKDCLRYWVTEMHVDGFRFDLAAIFTRNTKGKPITHSPLLESLSHDPILANTKLIAEPWDAAGLYLVGTFYSKEDRWFEWNGKYRDAIRRFLRGNLGEKRQFATRLCGSEDLYGPIRPPTKSINFVTAHDGFTLNDLVAYNTKRNELNGEDNQDGLSENDSWNCGHEGVTQNKRILAVRERQKRNFILGLMISQGIPMIQMGDEYGHTKMGNNNSWCQDNEMNWFLWDHIEKNKDFFRFYQRMIQFRKTHHILRLGRFLTAEDIDWHSIHPFQTDWEGDTQFLAFTLKADQQDYHLYIAFNAHSELLYLNLPPPPEGQEWHLVVNTANPSPLDFLEETKLTPLPHRKFRILGHSSILLKSYPISIASP